MPTVFLNWVIDYVAYLEWLVLFGLPTVTIYSFRSMLRMNNTAGQPLWMSVLFILSLALKQ